MADDRLRNFVLSLADADNALSEQARLVVLAALEGSNDLAEVLGDDATSSELVESLTTSTPAIRNGLSPSEEMEPGAAAASSTGERVTSMPRSVARR